MTFRDEYYRGRDFIKSPSPTFNVYASYKIRYSFTKNLEFNLAANVLILYSGDEIEEYGGQNPYSRYSLGVKYVLYSSDDRKNTVGLQGQAAFSDKGKLSIYPEMRLLLFRELFPGIRLTSNAGGIFISENKVSFIGSLEYKMLLAKRLELILEDYTDCVRLNSAGKASNRLLIGFGSYLRENFYTYLTYETKTAGTDYLNLGKIDLGMACRF